MVEAFNQDHHLITDDDPHILSHRVARLLPWLVATAFFMQMLDATILNTALPSIAKSLNASPLNMQYVVIAYTLTVALLMPASGWVADRFGTRRVFFAAVFLFTLGSLFCAIAPTLSLLVASRIVQGIGGAIMVPVGRLAILRGYPRALLLQVLSFVTMPALVGPLLGPVLGGFLVQYISWHWIFFINIPVGILGCWLTLRWMPDIYGTTKVKFDFKGFLLISTSLVLFSISIEGFGHLNMKHAEVLGLLITGVILMVCYWLLAARSADPLFSPELFTTVTFAVGIMGNMFSRFASGALPFLTPLLLQVGFGFSPIKSGLSLTPLALAAMFSKYLVRKLIPILGYRKLLIVNTLFISLMISSLSQVTVHTPYPLLLGVLALLGAANSMHFSAMSTLTLMDLPNKHASSGNAMLSVVMQLAISMGVAVAAALLQGFETRYASQGFAGLLHAFSATYICMGIIALLSTCIFLFVPRETGLLRDTDNTA